MYDRAPRVLAATAPLCRTSSGVGPGTYAVPDPSKFKTCNSQHETDSMHNFFKNFSWLCSFPIIGQERVIFDHE